MLSRTADNLYWIARYMERAETMARLLEVGARIALLPSSGTGYRSEWDSLLQASGTADRLCREVWRPGAAQHRKLSVLRPRQPVVRRLLPVPARARTRGSCARR